LRNELEKEGRIFLSDSDTEVIAHLLVKELMHRGLEDAVKEVMRRLIGSYSLAILIDKTLVSFATLWASSRFASDGSTMVM